MSEVTMHKCENCGMTVEDRHAYKGWIELDLRKISQQGGRNEQRHATTLVFKAFTCERENLMDFCGRDCLREWVGKTFQQVKRRSP